MSESLFCTFCNSMIKNPVHLSTRGEGFVEYERIRLNTGFDKSCRFCVEFYNSCYILLVDRRIIYNILSKS